MKTLVIGANGILGSKVVKEVAKRANVKAAQRSIEGANKMQNVEYVRFDYDDTSTYEASIKDVERVFMMAPPLDMKAYERILPFILKLEEKGVKKVVLLSALGVDNDDEIPLRKLELAFIKREFDYIFLRPNFFMENFSVGSFKPMIDAQELVLNAGEGKTSFIGADDIAQVAARVLFEERFNKQAFNLTGPKALSMKEALELIETKTDKSVRYINVDNDSMQQGLESHGMPKENAGFLVLLLDFIKNGHLSVVTNDVESILEKPALPFERFVEENI